jgi:LCP family protein required for cell wall assembly
MQIPRDIYVNHDYNGAHKCNTVFQYFKFGGNSTNEYIQKAIDKYDANKEPDLRGIAGFAAFLEQNLCVKIHYYAVMDLDQFANIVDALGGVEMNVPFLLQYDDPNQNLHINIYPGYQVLDGHAAEGVVRYRSGYANADIGRGNVQKMFMTALFKTIQDKANIFNIGKITDVCNIISDNLYTNMSTKDLIYFANNAMTLSLEYVTFMTMPGGGFWGDDGLAYYTLNKALTLDYINTYFNIYDVPVTDEQFDSNGVFYTTSYYYSCPASEMPQYIYSASEMAEEDFVPVVGY